MKLVFIHTFLIFSIFSCSTPDEPAVDHAEEVSEVVEDTSNTTEEEIELIDMFPEPIYEEPTGDEVLMENIKYLKGKVNDESVELLIFLNDYKNFGYLLKANEDVELWRVEGNYFDDPDSFSLNLYSQDVASKLNLGFQNDGYAGVQVLESDTIALELSEHLPDPSSTQFFIDEAIQMNLHLSTEGVYDEKPSYGTYFNKWMSFWSYGEGTDTGEMITDYYTSVIKKDSILILITGEVYKDMGAIYKDGHGYESDDPISIGEEYHSSASIDIKVIKNGVAKEQTIDLTKDFYVSLFTFENHLMFVNEETHEPMVYVWDPQKEEFVKLNE